MDIQKEKIKQEFWNWAKVENPRVVENAELGDVYAIQTLDHMFMGFAAAKAQAVPNTQALHDRLLVKSIREHVESHISEISVNDLFDKGWLAAMKCIKNNIDMLEAQEQTND